MGLLAAFAENPTLFVIIFAIGLPLIWWKWRVTGTVMTDQTRGLRADAKASFKPYETGIGTQDVFIMRPACVGGMLWFALGAMVAIEVNQTRIYVDAKTIQKLRVLHRRQTTGFADISTVDPIGKNFTTGLIIHSHDGAKIPVRAALAAI